MRFYRNLPKCHGLNNAAGDITVTGHKNGCDIPTCEDIIFDNIFFVPLTTVKFLAYDLDILGFSDVFGSFCLSSVCFGNRRKMFRKRSICLRTNSGKFLEVFEKWLEIF